MATAHPNLSPTGHEETSLKKLFAVFSDWWSYLWIKWRVILCCTLLGGLTGFAYIYLKKPIYTADTTFVLENGESSGGGLGQYLGLASMVGLDLGGGGGGIFQGDNILELYKSRAMIEKALLSPIARDTTYLLIDRYIDFNQLKKKWANQPALANLKFVAYEKRTLAKDMATLRLRDSIMGKVVAQINKKYLTVTKPNQRLDIIRVEVKAPDETFAKEFNNQIVKTVNDFYIQTKTKKAADNVNILQQKTDSVRAVMDGSIYTAVAATDATPNLNPTRQVQRMVPVQKAQFSAETNKAVLGELLKNLEMSKVSLRKETPLIQVIDQPVLPLKDDADYMFMYPIAAVMMSFLLIVIVLLLRRSILLKLS